jgi:hypothetical protein
MFRLNDARSMEQIHDDEDRKQLGVFMPPARTTLYPIHH